MSKASLKSNFVDKYELTEPNPLSQVMHVNDWEDIGIADPFPKEETFTQSSWIPPEKADCFVYSAKKENSQYVPLCTFIPNK